MSQVLCHLPKFHDDNLLVGFDTSDDASVYKINDSTAIIQTVDIFPPVVDDPFEYGQIAASNSLSDVYAMGGFPKLAMNVLCLPEDLPKDAIRELLQGGYEKVAEANSIITGGHTIKDHEPKYGLSVTGFVHPKDVLSNSGSKPGDVLILTKALGSGILTTASKADILEHNYYKSMVASMAELNKRAAEVMKDFREKGYVINSCTDITGFGLAGHSFEMAHGSHCTFVLNSSALPILDGAKEMAKMGIIPAGAYRNREWLDEVCLINKNVPLELTDILFDPQTSGGLLLSLPESDGIKLLSALNDALPVARLVGYVTEYDEYSLKIE